MKEIKLTNEQKRKLEEIIHEKYPDLEFDTEKVKVMSNNNNLKLSYGDINLEVSIPSPDQSTVNNIWSFIAGGLVAIGAAIALGLLINNNQE